MAYYRRDMLSISTRNILAQHLAESIFSESTLEPYREHLAKVPYFDCVTLFRYLDRGKKGYLNYWDFKHAMGNIEEKYLMYGFSRIDSLKFGEINRVEFAQFLLPKQNMELQELVAQRMGKPEVGQISDTIMDQVHLIGKIFQQIIVDEIATLAILRQQLLAAEDYSIKAVITALDVDRHEFVSAEDIYKFVRGHGIDLTMNQADIFIRMYDSNLDGKLESSQLEWAIVGLESQSSHQYQHNIRHGVRINLEKSRKQTKENKENHWKQPKSKSSKKQKFVKAQLVEKQIKKQKLPESYLLFLKLYQQKERAAYVIDQKLLQEEVQITEQIEIKKEEHLRDIEYKRKQGAMELHLRLQAQIKLRKHEQIEQQLKLQAEIKLRKHDEFEQQLRLQAEIKLRKSQEIERILKADEEKLRSLEEQRSFRFKIEEEKARTTNLEMQLNEELIYIERKCDLEAEMTIQKCYPKLTSSSYDTARIGQIYEQYSRPQRISRSRYQGMRPDLRDHLLETDGYLQKSKDLIEIIRKEREAERQIHQRLRKYDIKQHRKGIVTEALQELTTIYRSPEKRNLQDSKYLPSTGKYLTTNRKY